MKKIRIKLMLLCLPGGKDGIVAAIEAGDDDYPDSLEVFSSRADAKKETNQVSACLSAAKALRAAANRFVKLAASKGCRFEETTHNAINRS